MLTRPEDAPVATIVLAIVAIVKPTLRIEER
jgi:hypothetical protein